MRRILNSVASSKSSKKKPQKNKPKKRRIMWTELNIKVQVEIEILQIHLLSPKEEEELQMINLFQRKVLTRLLVHMVISPLIQAIRTRNRANALTIQSQKSYSLYELGKKRKKNTDQDLYRKNTFSKQKMSEKKTQTNLSKKLRVDKHSVLFSRGDNLNKNSRSRYGKNVVLYRM